MIPRPRVLFRERSLVCQRATEYVEQLVPSVGKVGRDIVARSPTGYRKRAVALEQDVLRPKRHVEVETGERLRFETFEVYFHQDRPRRRTNEPIEQDVERRRRDPMPVRCAHAFAGTDCDRPGIPWRAP